MDAGDWGQVGIFLILSHFALERAGRSILSERDTVLAKSIEAAIMTRPPGDERPCVVAVAGALHVNGVAECLRKQT